MTFPIPQQHFALVASHLLIPTTDASGLPRAHGGKLRGRPLATSVQLPESGVYYLCLAKKPTSAGHNWIPADNDFALLAYTSILVKDALPPFSPPPRQPRLLPLIQLPFQNVLPPSSPPPPQHPSPLQLLLSPLFPFPPLPPLLPSLPLVPPLVPPLVAMHPQSRQPVSPPPLLPAPTQYLEEVAASTQVDKQRGQLSIRFWSLLLLLLFGVVLAFLLFLTKYCPARAASTAHITKNHPALARMAHKWQVL